MLPWGGANQHSRLVVKPGGAVTTYPCRPIHWGVCWFGPPGAAGSLGGCEVRQRSLVTICVGERGARSRRVGVWAGALRPGHRGSPEYSEGVSLDWGRVGSSRRPHPKRHEYRSAPAKRVSRGSRKITLRGALDLIWFPKIKQEEASVAVDLRVSIKERTVTLLSVSHDYFSLW
ncbi:hypothetical protein NDU88_004319 [Pleurodeles waltl]|uniref:Uncharacterized protein n=1 Tax=Pleurodeles waltl TaxID=8319 RepID=A0AAV7LJH7_PLEWA|nr:hypothetical protein NDU88_004319 [Pleurodeles waltl]